MRAILLGTGPSLTPEVIEQVNASSLPKFGCNNTYQVANLDVLLACNPEWWDYYWPRDQRLRDGGFQRFTWDAATQRKYRIGYIEGRWGDSLSTDSRYIHYGHSSGYQLLGLAYHFRMREMILCGYDLRYPAGYNRETQKSGGFRHFWAGGEYPPELQHWPRVGPNGEMIGLLDCYRTIDCKALGLRIINTSPGSALDFFETATLEDALQNR